MIEGYLLERDGLEMVFVLVDGAIGPTPLDQQMLDWLREYDVPHTVVATKTDKVKSAKKRTRKRELAAGCMLDPGDIVWVSASKAVNIDQLRGLVIGHLRTD
jgi:GTP-binding protein